MVKRYVIGKSERDGERGVYNINSLITMGDREASINNNMNHNYAIINRPFSVARNFSLKINNNSI